MAYNVFFTNSTPSPEFPDGHHRVFDGGVTSATDRVIVPEGPNGVFELISAAGDAQFSLVGKYKLGYGNEFAFSLLHVLENFASSLPVNGMVHGQTWYADLRADDVNYIKNTLYLYKGLGPALGGGDPAINPSDLYALLDKETPRTLQVVPPAEGLSVSHSNYVLQPRSIDGGDPTGLTTRVEVENVVGLNPVNLNDGRGTITISLTHDLAAIEGLTGTGLAVRSAPNTWVQRTVAGTSNKIDVANGDGVAGNPTLTISPTYIGQTSITTLGLVGFGTWQASTIAAIYGGTGISSYTPGDIMYADSATTLAKLGGSSSGNVLLSGTSPSWGKVGLSTHVSGNLPVSNLNFGTGATSTTFWNGDGVWATPSVSTVVGVLPIANGGTGANNIVSARDNLGLEIGVDIPSLIGLGATGLWNINISGNAATVTTNANLTGDVSSVGNATTLASIITAGSQGTGSMVPVITWDAKGRLTAVTSAAITAASVGAVSSVSVAAAGVGISSSGSPITSSGTITITSNATSTNTPSTIVARDSSGNFTATTITAALAGNAATATALATPRTIQTNLASTSAVSFDGSANVTPGVTGTLAITSGGTGQTTANAAFNALAPSQSTHTGKFLQTDGSNTSWQMLTSGNVTTALGYTPVNKAGDTMTGFLTLNADPISNLHAATKKYVDDAAAGLTAKASVRAATTGPITLSGLQTIDGVVLAAAQRVLVKNQSTASENGIYNANAGAWTRSIDFDGAPGNEVASGAYVFVREGTTQAATGWVLSTSTDPIVVGTDPLPFVQFSGGGTFTNGLGLNLAGNTFSVDQTWLESYLEAGSFTWNGSHAFTNLITGSISGNAATVTTNANLTGDVTSSGNATTLVTVNGSVGTFGSATSASQITVNAKGLITSASSVTITPAFASITGKPTTLGGYGITDGQPLSSVLTAYAGGDTPSAFVLGIVDAVDAAAFRAAIGAGTGGGSVTSVSVSGSNGIGVSGSPITTSGTITLSLGAITPTSVAASGTVTGSNLSGTHTGTSSGSNTGDQTITLTGDVAGSGTGSFATTLASVISAGGPVGSASVTPVITYDAKGRLTAVTSATITPAAIGAPTTTGTGASGTWGISITGNSATSSNASLLNGRNWSDAVGANTIVTRQASGYTYLNYINSDSPINENPAISQVIVTGADNAFFRKASLTNFGAQQRGATSVGGANRLTRRDWDGNDYTVQTNFDGTRWLLRGYTPGDAYHAPCRVEYSDRAAALSGLASTASGAMNAVVVAVTSGDDPIKYSGTLLHRPSDGYTGCTYIGNTGVTSYINLTTSGASWTDLTMVGPATGGYQGFRFATSGRLLMVGGATGFYTGAAWMHYHDGSTLQVTGAIVASGDITAFSDARLKDNVVTIDAALDKVKKLRGVAFDWKDIDHNSTRRGKHAYGVIAQEVEEVLPFMVDENTSLKTPDDDSAETYKTVDYSKLVPLLLEAIKEQQKQIDELKAKVNL